MEFITCTFCVDLAQCLEKVINKQWWQEWMVCMPRATRKYHAGCALWQCRRHHPWGCRVMTCIAHTCLATCGGPVSTSQPLAFIFKLKNNHSNGTHMLNILWEQYKLKTGLQKCVRQEETVTKCPHTDLMIFTLLYMNMFSTFDYGLLEGRDWSCKFYIPEAVNTFL